MSPPPASLPPNPPPSLRLPPPQIMLRLYGEGAFPMAESRDDPGFQLVEARQRGLLPLDGFHISQSLARSLRRGLFLASVDLAREAVIAACADRLETWINPALRQIYRDLGAIGHCHSLEIWPGQPVPGRGDGPEDSPEDSPENGGTPIGGVFGIALGGVFFAESMFSHRRDASKAALAFLVDHLRARGFGLLDTQFLTPHLASLGGIELPRAEFLRLLAPQVARQAGPDAPDFGPAGALGPAAGVLERHRARQGAAPGPQKA